jgi:N-acetylglucosaminyl-diphospho-decaprenol L-rhamnosyltransferase
MDFRGTAVALPQAGTSNGLDVRHRRGWTIITVTFNSAATLERFWKSGGDLPFTWIVVDNCSTDSTRESAARLGAHVIALPENVGFSAANNVGLTHCDTEYVAFVNPDVDLSGTSFEALETSLSRRPGLVAPQLTNTDGTLQPNGRGYPTIWAKLGNRLLRRTDDSYRIYASAGQDVIVCWLMGAFVGGTRAMFERIGGWNSSYFLYYEDSEIGLRAAQHGVESRVVGATTAEHGWARETTTFRWRPWVNEMRSALRFYSTHPRLLLPITWTAPVGSSELGASDAS